MANSSGILDKWREYFSSANSDIFSIIEYAIMVAASDFPYDFKLNRDRIAEMLFSCKMTKCYGCEKIELAVPSANCAGKFVDKCKSGIEAGGSKDTKESKVNSSVDDDRRQTVEMNVNQVSNCNYGDAEALADEIEEDSQLFEEVLKIKEILDNSEAESDGLLFGSLKRLQLIPLSVETLKASEIGKSVSALRKHGSKEVRNLVREIIGDWTAMVDAWVSSTTAITDADAATESVKTSAVEKREGLSSPPLDEGAFFATPCSMELSQFFDGMDDDGNPINTGDFNKNPENGRGTRFEKPKVPKLNLDSQGDASTPSKYRKECKKNQETTVIKQAPPCKPSRLLSNELGPSRTKSSLQAIPSNEINVRVKLDKGIIRKKPMQSQQEKLHCINEASVEMKVESTKRKLQECYQAVKDAKKQRTVQVMEFHELPKKNLAQRNQSTRHANYNKQRANGRL